LIDIKTQDSATDIGIDSIQSVQLSLSLEKQLGYLPSQWRTQSIAELDALKSKARVESKPTIKSSTGKAEPIWDGSCGIRDITDLSAKPTIENGVNIGAGVVIVGDIVIGRYSVIGPNCVITESLPPFSVVSSAPVNIKSP